MSDLVDKRPRFTARGVWRGCVEIAPIAAFTIPFGIAFGVAASRILVGVHSVLRESLVFGDFRVPGQGRMDNLLKIHS